MKFTSVGVANVYLANQVPLAFLPSTIEVAGGCPPPPIFVSIRIGVLLKTEAPNVSSHPPVIAVDFTIVAGGLRCSVQLGLPRQ